MKRFKISKEQSVALDESIAIWKHRAAGAKTKVKCPLCTHQYSVSYQLGCGDCVITQDCGGGCSDAEYFDWANARDEGRFVKMQEHAVLMYDRLVRLKDESIVVDKPEVHND